MASTLQNLIKEAEKKKVAERHKTEADNATPNHTQLPTTTKDTQDPPSTTTYKEYKQHSSERSVQIIPPERKTPTSPVSNYTKVPNSLTAEAIPNGLFKGLSKHTYDVLYKLTRGAISPTREIQVTRLELMKLTGLSENTQRSHIKYLSLAGLLKVSYLTGKHEGATYEVLIPEEITATTNHYQPLPSPAQHYQEHSTGTDEYAKLTPVTSHYLGGVGTSETVENKEVNTDPNTSLKTINTNDDEEISAFAELIRKFGEASLRVHGRKLSRKDASKWGDLADLLILELEMAAKQAKGVSSIPAFLTEVLRRRLFAVRSQKAKSKDEKYGKDTVGKSSSGTYEIKKLSVEERQSHLQQLSEFAEDDFLESFQKWYTTEDWKWLMENLDRDTSI